MTKKPVKDVKIGEFFIEDIYGEVCICLGYFFDKHTDPEHPHDTIYLNGISLESSKLTRNSFSKWDNKGGINDVTVLTTEETFERLKTKPRQFQVGHRGWILDNIGGGWTDNINVELNTSHFSLKLCEMVVKEYPQFKEKL